MNISRQIQNCKKNNNFDIALEKFINSDLSLNNVNIIFSMYVENYEKLKFRIDINKMISYIKNFDFTLECQIMHLYCLNNDIDNAFIFYNQIKNKYVIFKKKMFSPFIDYYNKNSCDRYFDIIITDIIENNVILDPDHYIIIFNKLIIKYEKLLLNFIEYFKINKIKLDLNTNETLNFNLKYIDINTICDIDILKKVENEIKKKDNKFINFKNWCLRNLDTNIIIDAGNIGYFNNTYKDLSIKQINKSILDLKSYKIKIFIHNRHLINLSDDDSKIIESWKKKNILFKTRSGINDDYYWLYYSLLLKFKKKEVNIITNDDLRDHIFKFGMDLKYIRDEIRVKYNILDKKFIYYFPPKYSHLIQYDNVNIYIPINNYKFIALKKNNILTYEYNNS